jgi:hypothetical protein
MSAFYDLASLVVVPSGYKSGKIYAQKPLTTDGQLTFSRASTATRVNASGLIETVASNVPRLDYLGSTCPKLQLEPQRSNVITFSEDITQTGAPNWIQYGGVTVTANNTTSPDGYVSADKMNSTGGVYTQRTFTAGTAYAISVFIKKDTATSFRIDYVDQSGPYRGGVITYTFATGAITVTTQSQNASVSGEAVDYGNGWIRLTMKMTANASANYAYQSFYFNGGEGWVWGFQMEAGAYATSYVKTEAAAVTRLEENAVKTSISSLLGQTEGTLFIEIDPQDISGQGRHISMESASGEAGGWIGIFSSGATPNTFRFYGNGFDFSGGPALRGVRAKAALAYKNGVLTSAYVNGVSVGTLTANTNGKSYAKLELAAGPFGNGGSCNYRQALVFKTALTPAQLAELTAL